LAAIWDQGQGCRGLEEPAEAYDRFMQFLELGPDRTLTTLAKILGISHQAIGKVAARFNWRKRAEAYDRSKGRKGKPKRTAPPSPPPPRPPQPPKAPQSPSPASTAKVINPEVLGQQQEGTTALAESHLQVLSRYRKAYDAIGSGMAEEAQALFPLVRAFRGDLELARQLWRDLLEQQEIERANVMARMLWDLIPAYYRLCETMHGLANGGRTHWGDSAGVHKLLEEAFTVRKGQP
jgi:hypothetical protein